MWYIYPATVYYFEDCQIFSVPQITVQFLVGFEIKPVRTGLKSNGIHRLLIYFRAYIIIYSFQAFFLPHCKKLQNHSSVFFLSFLSHYLFKLTLLENSWTVLKTFIIIRKSVFYLQYSNVESLFCNGFYYFFLTQPSGSCWR